VNRCKHAAPTAHVIDGVSGDAQIVELWSAKFEIFIMWCTLDFHYYYNYYYCFTAYSKLEHKQE